MNQIDIYDLLTPQDLDEVNFRTMTDEEIAAHLGKRLGLKFEFNGFFNEYQAKVGGRVLQVHTSHYSTTGEPFLSCGYMDKKTLSGCGNPCDSLASAYTFLHRAKEGAEE